MIEEVPTQSVELSTEDVCWVDNEEHVFLMYRMDSEPAAVKIKGQADILKLRDLLNAAYPPAVTPAILQERQQW
ncbi:hypothetical protein ACE3MQ_25190 [Paenibacillus lentus]|uniref:hypothetical protein n=1 Tax=Paenibacillus lentus TaxID=1338368 RepID=UPI00365E8C5C